jgi:hypothetical protein
VNLPHTSRNIAEWIKKALEESVEHGITIVMLLPSRTDMRWFHDHIYRKPNVEHTFIRGRLKFKVDISIQAVPNTDPFPSMIAILFRPYAIVVVVEEEDAIIFRVLGDLTDLDSRYTIAVV